MANQIYGTDFDNSTDAQKKVFAAVDPKSTPRQGATAGVSPLRQRPAKKAGKVKVKKK